MRKLLQGVIDFHKRVRPEVKDTFARLALGQAPDALFIACSDSRVAANVFASTDPGDLFVVRNVGKEDHEFLLASTEDNLKHAEAMKKNSRMEHDDPNGVRLAPNKSAEIVWKFTKSGTFEYSCLIPNHREYGMTGRITVK